MGLIKFKNLFRLLLLVVLIVGLCLIKPFGGSQAEASATHTMVVKQVEELGRLEVAKYSISDVIHYKKHRTWLPNSHTAILVMGEVIACVDLTKIEPEDIVIDDKEISLTLPTPEICTFKVDHAHSKVYDVKFGLWDTQELVDEAYKEAEKQIYKQAMNMGINDESRVNARKVLVPLIKMMGFETVNINFKESSLDEVGKMPRMKMSNDLNR